MPRHVHTLLQPDELQAELAKIDEELRTRVHRSGHFYDAAEPRNVPSGSLAAVYVNTDGSFAWAQDQVNRMGGVFGISESRNPEFARFARCAAVEPGADDASHVAAFLKARIHYGHRSDGMAYVNLGNWELTERACIDADVYPHWWVAHPGDRHPEELRSPIRGRRPLCVQNIWTNGYDISEILGELQFTPPHHFKATG